MELPISREQLQAAFLTEVDAALTRFEKAADLTIKAFMVCNHSGHRDVTLLATPNQRIVPVVNVPNYAKGN